MNIADILCGEGQKVFCVDLDLCKAAEVFFDLRCL